MYLRLKCSVLGNSRFGLAAGVALAAGVGCSDDDAVPEVPGPDGGISAETTGSELSSTGAESTSGGGGATSESSTPADTSGGGLTVTVGESSGGDTSVATSDAPTNTSDVPVDTSDVMTTSEMGGGNTSAPVTSGDTSDEGTLVASYDFESGVSGWESWDGAISISTTTFRSGAQSLAQSGGENVGPAATPQLTLVPGATYRATFWASADAAAQVHVTFTSSCDTSEFLWISPVKTLGAEWMELTGEVTVPEDCVSPTGKFYAEGTGSGVTLFVDDVSIWWISGGTDTGSTDSTSGVMTSAPDTTDPDSGVVDTTEVMDDAGVDASTPEETMDMDDAGSDAGMMEDAASEPPLDPYGPELIVNPTFEGGGSGATWWWYAAGGDDGATIAASDVYAHNGSYSLFASNRTLNWHGAGVNLLEGGTTTPVVAGHAYHISAWVQLAGAASALVVLSGTVNCETVLTYPWLANGTATDAGWVEISGDFTAPACAAAYTSFSMTVNNPASGVDIYVDDVSLREILIP